MSWSKSRWLFVVLIASVAFNAGMGTTFGVRVIQQHWHQPHGAEHVHATLHERLQLRPEQLEQINAGSAELHDQLRGLLNALTDEYALLAELIIAVEPDEAAIAEKLETLNKLHGKKQEMIVEHFVRFSKLLDDAQREVCQESIGSMLSAHDVGHHGGNH